MNEEYTCCLSGVRPEEEELSIPTSDDLGDIPVGWSRITIQTRVPNPHWLNIQKIKKDLVDELLLQVDDEKKDQARQIMFYQVEAQYASLEAQTSPYFIDERVCFVSNPQTSEQVKEEFDLLLERLDLVEEDE